jgi:hypothetical protein
LNLYTNFFWFYVLAIVPLIGFFLDIFSLISPINVKIIGLFLKDFPIIILVLFTFFIFRKNVINKNTILLIIILLYFVISYYWNNENSNINIIGAALRNEILYPCLFFVAYKIGSKTNFKEYSQFKLLVFSFSINILLGFLQYNEILATPYKELNSLGGGDNSFAWVHGGMISYIQLSFFLSLSIIIFSLIIDKLTVLKIYKKMIKIFILSASLILIISSQSRLGLIIYFISSLSILLRDKVILFVFIFTIIISGIYFIFFGINFEINHRLLNFDGSDPRFEHIYPYAIDLISKQLFFGYGLGSYGPATIVGDEIVNGLNYLDSTYLSLLLQFGLIGFILYIFFTCYVFFQIHQMSVILRKYDLVLANILTLIIVIIYCAFFNFANAWPGSVFVFCWMGYILSVLNNLINLERIKKISR